MSGWTRAEIEREWERYKQVALECGPAENWDPFCDLYTEHAVMVIAGGIKIGGREAMKRWYRAAFSEEPFKYLYYYPVPWAIIDEYRGYVACEFQMRMADPGDGSVHESSCFSILHYAGNGLWSYEEDKYDPAELEAMIAGWVEAKARCDAAAA
jgi:hypothetical protein